MTTERLHAAREVTHVATRGSCCVLARTPEHAPRNRPHRNTTQPGKLAMTYRAAHASTRISFLFALVYGLLAAVPLWGAEFTFLVHPTKAYSV